MANSGNLKLILSARLEGSEPHDIGAIELPVVTETLQSVGHLSITAKTSIDSEKLEHRLRDFAAAVSEEIAGPELPPAPLPLQEALAFAEAGMKVAVFAENLELAQEYLGKFEDILDHNEVGRIVRTNGQHAITFRSGGLIRFHSTRAIPRGRNFDRLYIPAKAADRREMEQLEPLVATSDEPAIVGYFPPKTHN